MKEAAGSVVGDTDGRFVWGVTLAFALVATIATAYHEPWRDEAQAWLLARDSSGLPSLLRSSRHEGGPILWHVLLLPLTRCGGPALMSALNLLFATGTVYLFVRFSPFDRLTRALFPFGYLPLYEWGTLARNYAVGAFFLFLFAVATSRRRPVVQGLALAAAANSSVHAALVAASALAFVLVAALTSSRESARSDRRGLVVVLAVAVLGLLVSFIQVLPPAGARLTWVGPATLHRLWSVVCSLPAGFAPFVDCWFVAVPPLGSAWLQVPVGAVAILLTLALLATASAHLIRRRTAWIVPALSLLLLGGLFLAVWWRGPRHAGFLFLAMLVGLWLAPFCPERGLADGRLARAVSALARRLPQVMRVVLLFEVLVGAIAVVVEIVTVFSAARPTADVVREQGFGGLPVVADPDFVATSIVAHLGVRSAYYPQVNRWGSFVNWAEHPPNGNLASPDTLVFDQAARLADHSDVVVVVNRRADADLVKRVGASFVAARSADVVKDESFWIYRLAARQGGR